MNIIYYTVYSLQDTDIHILPSVHLVDNIHEHYILYSIQDTDIHILSVLLLLFLYILFSGVVLKRLSP